MDGSDLTWPTALYDSDLFLGCQPKKSRCGFIKTKGSRISPVRSGRRETAVLPAMSEVSISAQALALALDWLSSRANNVLKGGSGQAQHLDGRARWRCAGGGG